MLQLKATPHDKSAWERFLEMGAPTSENEVYRYVRLRDLYSTDFQLPQKHAVHFKTQEGTLVFVNGSYAPALSKPPQPFLAIPLSEAFKTYGGFLNPRLQKQLQDEKDPFAVLNQAYCSEGLFLYIPPKSICESTLKIVHLTSQQEYPILLSPRIYLFAAKGSSAKLSFSQNLPSHVWSNAVLDISIEETSSVHLNLLSNQEEEAHSFLALRAAMKEGSQLKTFSFTNGGATSREDYAIRLNGKEASAHLYGAWHLKKTRQHHVNILMDHNEPFCTSLQKFKGILEDASRSSFEGKIHVHQRAQKTMAYQMNNNLILGERASANSKPNLEIFADDVKASHGATVGQLDPELLFYLTARGISPEWARALLVKGFSHEILNLLEEGSFKREASEVLA